MKTQSITTPGEGRHETAFDRHGNNHSMPKLRQTACGFRKFIQRAVGGIPILLVALLAACGNVAPTAPPPPEAMSPTMDGTLVAGDEIRIMFQGAPDLNTQQRIQPNGKISLPTIGEVTAAGRSINRLEAHLASRYQSKLQDPTVSVSMVSSAAGVYVSGAVQRPGKVMLYRPMTAMEAVMEAGGFTPMANPKQVTVIRTRSGASKSYVINLDQILHGVQTAPFYLKSYDVIHVPDRVW